MTFYDAALQVLEREGKPLHFKAITERAVHDKLLSHVGNDPEVVMYSRLAAMARRKGDRRVVATEAGTFGLLDWGVQEDPHALEAQVIDLPDESDVPYRPRERHPMPIQNGARGAGRGERWQKQREERDARKKLPSLPEVVFEALSQAKDPMAAVDLASLLREGERVASDLGAETLLNALREDNRRRQSHDRRPLFIISEAGEVSVDRAGAPGAGVPVDLQAAFAQALGVPLEGGGRGEGSRTEPRSEKLGPGAQRIMQQVREHQRTMGRLLRRRFGDLELGAIELVMSATLEAHGFRDARAMKRTPDGVVFSARRREGLLDIRYALRAVRGSREISKQDVLDLRTEMSVYNAQVGVLVGAGDASRDARSDAVAGSGLLLLWVGEALADKLLEKKVGTTTVSVEITDLDDGFFRRVRDQGVLDDRRREERRAEREAREQQERAERAARDSAPSVIAPTETAPSESPPVPEALPLATAEPTPVDVVASPSSEPTAVESSAAATIEVRVDLSGSPPLSAPPPSPESIAADLARNESESGPPPGDPPKAT